jgi:hypothetical protein
MPSEKQIMQKSVEPVPSGKEEACVTLMCDLKKTWFCLGCNSSFLHHYEIVKHMHSENHLIIVNSDFGQANGVPQAEIMSMPMHVLHN